MSDLNSYMKEVRETMDAKGFRADPDRFTDFICRIHSEVTEAFQEWKHGNDEEAIARELVDAFIYICHLMSVLDIDFEAAYVAKMATNRERPYRYNTGRGG